MLSLSVYDVIVSSDINLDEDIKEEIRQAMNTRWLQMIDNAPHDVYLTGFVLDPRACHDYAHADRRHAMSIRAHT